MKKVMGIMIAVFLNAIFLCAPISAKAEKFESAMILDQLIKSEVETAHSMLQAIFSKHQKGEMGLEEAKKLGADLLRELRYGTEGYFWADTTEGVNIVLYGRKDVEGKNRLEAKDMHGIFYIREFIAKAKTGGYVEYWFPKRGESDAQPKRSCVLLFEPFGWIIGTGYYRDILKGEQ